MMTGQPEGYLITEEEWEKCLNHIELLRNVDIPWKETKNLLDGITRIIRSRPVQSEQSILTNLILWLKEVKEKTEGFKGSQPYLNNSDLIHDVEIRAINGILDKIAELRKA